ncbi:MAG: helix-turn-helix domain-containing protein [Anaerolineales bacterium]
MLDKNLAERLKSARAAQDHKGANRPAADPVEVSALRARITGVLIRDARIAKGYTVEQVADVMGVGADDMVAWEFGQASPSLPQLELLAYWLEVPVTHFISGTQTLLQQLTQRALDATEYETLRNRMIGAELRGLRESAGFTLAYLAERVGLAPELLQAYEYGQRPVPIVTLTTLAQALNINITEFLEGTNRIGKFLQAQELQHTFQQMDPQVRQFVANPSSHAYIELAMKLAEMDTNKLRNIAENLLEITL